MDTAQKSYDQGLKSDLARLCLPDANRDSNRKLAWVNSLCIFFLIVGVFGAQRASVHIKTPPPLEEVIPAIVEALPTPPAQIEAQQNEEDKPAPSDVPQVVVVVPESPAINFSIPTVGNLVVSIDLAQAPPADSLKSIAPMRSGPTSIDNTGESGDRPQPPYPKTARDLGQQGAVLLTMTVNETGLITQIEITQSSGSSILDRSTLDFVKKHWILPPGAAGRVFEAPIRFILAQ